MERQEGGRPESACSRLSRLETGPLFTQPSFSFLLLFPVGQRGVAVLTWLADVTSPWGQTCFVHLLNEEASFETHSLAAHDETPYCLCQNQGVCQGFSLHCLKHGPPRVCLARFNLDILGKTASSGSRHTRPV